MDKLKMAHEYALEMAKQGIPLKSCKELGWKYADAMQAEAEKRENKERPDVLKEEWQPDWSKAPETAIAWKMQSKSNAVWVHNKRLSAFEYSIAPSFNYQGNWQDSLRKRPEVLCEVDWSVAPCWAKDWVMLDGVAKWECGTYANSWEDAPSFGFTGSHIVERPQ